MMDPDPELLDAALRLARELPSATLQTIARVLETHGDWDSAAARVSVQLSTAAVERWGALLQEARRSVWCTPGRLGALLRGASTMDESWRRMASLEVVWTGPTPLWSTFRRTDQALLEVVRTAQRELWVVSFAAYKVESICSALVEAAARGVDVRLVLESESESGGKLSFGGIDAMPAEVRSACELYVWPLEKRPETESGKTGTLHAKCALADGQLLFVSSANLTEFAFERNMELGVLVRERRTAQAVQQQLRWLASSGRLERVV